MPPHPHLNSLPKKWNNWSEVRTPENFLTFEQLQLISILQDLKKFFLFGCSAFYFDVKGKVGGAIHTIKAAKADLENQKENFCSLT